MIPPELRERLIRGLTQKLVESPTFNNLVRTFHHTLDNFAQGIEEGRTGTSASKPPPPDSEAPPSSHETWQAKEQQQQQPQQASSRPEAPRRPSPADAQPQQQQRQQARRPPEQEQSHSQPEPAPATSSDAKLNELQAYLARIRSGLQEAEQRAEEQKRKQK